MIYQDLKKGNHHWEKQNLVTIPHKKGSYDILFCKCGLKGKRRGLVESIELDSRQSKKAKQCTYYKLKEETGRKIKITHCSAQGPIFVNITDGSEHLLITPPEGRDKTEYWVMGIGEPIRLLDNEFKFI